MTGGRKRVVVPSAYNENVGDFWFFPKTASQQDNKGRGPQPVQLFLNAGDQVIPMMELSELRTPAASGSQRPNFLCKRDRQDEVTVWFPLWCATAST